MESDETNMPPFIGLARPLSAQAEAMPAPEVLGERCIDGGKCHHQCESKCFRRECCGPLSGYTGPWKYEAMPAQPDLAAQPVAWIQSNHLDNIRRDHRFHCSLADHKFQSDYRPLYTAPPDLSAQAVLPCGHHSSLMLKSAETGEDLYCELCDCISRRRDAEMMETQARAECEKLRATLRSVVRYERSFDWNSEKQCHVQWILVEFADVPAGSDNDSRGWRDRDAFAAAIDAARKEGEGNG